MIIYAEDVDGNREKLWELNHQITEKAIWEEGQVPLMMAYDYNVSIDLRYLLIYFKCTGFTGKLCIANCL